MGMTQLNIRDFPDDVLKRAKIAAIENGLTLKKWVIQVLETASKTPKGRKARKGA